MAAWEIGEAVPTIAQLRKAAEVYKRSLAVFFLSEPPEGFVPTESAAVVVILSARQVRIVATAQAVSS